MYGNKDKRKKKLAVYSESGKVPLHAESVFDRERGEIRFALYDKERQSVSYPSSLLWPADHVTYIPQDGGMGGLLDKGTIMLPSQAEDYGSEEDLIAEIEGFIRTFLVLPEQYYTLVTYYVLLTWVGDCFPTLPYLRARGDTGSGKSRLLQTIGAVSYTPIFAAGATTASPIFRIYDAFPRATFLFDEADWDTRNDEFGEIIKILNMGYMKGLAVLRASKEGNEIEARAYDCFGPKILGTRNAFGDQALESRCLTIKMGPSKSLTVPESLGLSFWRGAERLRNKLLMWRFKRFKIFDEVPSLNIEDISPRLRGIMTPMVLIAESQVVKDQLVGYLKSFDSETKESRALDWDTRAMDALLQTMNAQAPIPGVALDIPLADITNRLNHGLESDGEQKMTARQAFQTLRNRLNVTMTRKHNKLFVTATPEEIGLIAQSLGLEIDVPVPWINPPDTDASGDVTMLDDIANE